MKVQVEKKPESVSTLKIELPADEVSKEWDVIANSFARFAKIPGYRPGKAPRSVIEKRFRREIHDELTKKLVSRSYHDAIEQKNLRVVSLTNVEDVQFGDDKSMRFRATIVTAPEFELPEYRNIPVQLSSAKVANEDVDLALERLREQSADFDGAIDGKPIRDITPTRARTCTAARNSGCILGRRIFCRDFASRSSASS